MQEKIPKSIKQALIITAIASAITGGLVGGTSAVLIGGYGSSSFWPYISETFGFSSEKTGQSQEEQGANSQVVVEDSAAINVAKQSSKAVVSIVVSQDLSFSSFDDFFFFGTPFYSQTPSQGKQKIGGGTGFIITTDGMIVTNRHVVEEEDAEYTVVFNDNTQYEAKVLARDDINDIAVIKIEADNLPILDFGDSDSIQIGQTVIAIGNSLGEFSNTVTKGVISGINRKIEAGNGSGFSEAIEEAIQTDAAINPGNSGGPLLDLFGKVIGVNTAVSSQGQLIGFAIPINSVKSVIQSVQQFGRIVRPFIGIRYIILNEEIAKANEISGIDHGALVLRGDARTDLAVMPGSPADKAGLVENDIILEINGEKITQDNNLSKMIAKYNPGDIIKLKVHHKGSEKEFEVTLVERK